MKIKIERYEYTPSEHRYRAYHGFTCITFTYPFHTKWVLDRDNMNNIEMLEYVSRFLIFGKEVKFKIE
jgi:hypothetical protein